MAKATVYSYLVAFAAAIGGLLFGYEIGVIGQVMALDSFGLKMGYRFLNATSGLVEICDDNNYGFGCTSFEKDTTGWIACSFLLSCAVGSIIVGYTADALGRKWSLFIGSTIFSAGALLQALTNDLPVLYVGRVVSGVGVGIMSMVVPLYITETAPTETRGQMTTSYQLMITIGILIATGINAGIIAGLGKLSEQTWRLCMGVQVIPGVLLMIVMMFMPYSPRWLANKDRDTESMTVLARLRGVDVSNAELQFEFREIKDAIELERKAGSSSIKELFSKGIFNRVIMAMTLQMFQQFTGINGVMYYQTKLYQILGFSDAAQQGLTVALGFVNFLGTFPGMFLIERMGRKKLLMYGGIGIGFSHAMIFMFGKLSENQFALGYGAFASMALFDLFFASTWGPVVWVYQSEIFPLRVRSLGAASGTFSNWIFNAVVSKLQPLSTASIGPFTYIIYAVFGILMATYVGFCVPETAGRALEEIDEIFGGVTSPKGEIDFNVVV